MNEQQVTIELPVIKVTIGNTERQYLGPLEAKVASANDIRRIIRNAIPSNEMFKCMKKDAIEAIAKGVDITFKDGTAIKVPMNHTHGWKFDVTISTSMINKAMGKHVPVTYGNFVHNALYKIQGNNGLLLSSIGLEFQSDLDSRSVSERLLQEFRNNGILLSDYAPFISIEETGNKWLITDVRGVYSIRREEDRLNVYNRFNVSDKAAAALVSLGFTTKDGVAVTATGATVLSRLETVNPAEDKSCRMKFTRALVSAVDPTTPAFTFALENAYVHYVEEDDKPREYWYTEDYKERGPITRFYPTKKGAQWLETNCEKILKHHSCSPTRRLQMIPYLPMSHLNVYLTSEKQEERLAAKARLKALEGGS